MRPVLLTFAFLIACGPNSAAFAFGAVAIGYLNGNLSSRYNYQVVVDDPTKQEAAVHAMRNCNAMAYRQCQVIFEFQNKFIAISTSEGSSTVHVEAGKTADEAVVQVLSACRISNVVCTDPGVFQDKYISSLPVQTNSHRTSSLEPPIPNTSMSIHDQWHAMTFGEKLADIFGDAVLFIRTPFARIPFENPFLWTTIFFVVITGVLYYIRRSEFRSLTATAPLATGFAEPQSRANEQSDRTPVHQSAMTPPQETRLPAVIPMIAEDQFLHPDQPMALKLRRSQRDGALGGAIYMLDARIEVSAEVNSLIAKHRLGSRLIYESEARQKHAARAQSHLAGSKDNTSLFAPPSAQAAGIAKSIWKLGRAAVSATRASFALRVTVSSLLAGVHVECKSLDELLEAEGAFREAKENLEGYVDAARTFDGREEIV
jgi:hypothetical protein